MTANKPVRAVPAGLRQVMFMLKAVSVPVALARKTCPKELLLKQLNNVKGAEFAGFVSHVGGVGKSGMRFHRPRLSAKGGVCATPPMLYAKAKSQADVAAFTAPPVQLLSVAPLPVVAAINEAVYPGGPLFQLKSIPMLMPLGPGPDARAAVVHRNSAVSRNRNSGVRRFRDFP